MLKTFGRIAAAGFACATLLLAAGLPGRATPFKDMPRNLLPQLTYNRIFGIGGNPANASDLQGSALPKTTLVSDAVFGAAGIVGLRFKIWGADQTLAYYSVGSNFIASAPFEWSGQAPFLFAFNNFPQLPGFLGTGNDLALNNQVDSTAVGSPYPGPLLANNPNYPHGTLPLPLFNQFHAEGPYYSSSYPPSARGPQVQLNLPFRIGNLPVKLRLGGQSLQELQPNSLATQIFGPAFSSSARGRFAQAGGGATLNVPVFARTATISLNGLWERLLRNDQTPFVYAADPLLGTHAFNPAASLQLIGTGKSVMFYPNYTNVVHTLGSAQASVSLTSALTANVQYVGQRYTGEALNTLTDGISERKTMLTGGVLYNIPKTNSSVNLWFARYTYTDDKLPSYNWSQNRQNLYFTVKF